MAGLELGGGGLGGSCGPSHVPLQTLDSQPVDVPYVSGYGAPVPLFGFRVLDGTAVGLQVRGSLGLYQETEFQDSCMYYNTVGTPNGLLGFATALQVRLDDSEGLAFNSMDEARAFMETEEYADLKRLFLSMSIAS